MRRPDHPLLLITHLQYSLVSVLTYSHTLHAKQVMHMQMDARRTALLVTAPGCAGFSHCLSACLPAYLPTFPSASPPASLVESGGVRRWVVSRVGGNLVLTPKPSITSR